MANGTPKLWYEQLHDWLKRNPKKHWEITNIYGRQRLRGMCSGDVKLDGIPPGKRQHLYDVTGLECFSVEGEHPLSLDIEKMRNGQQPRSLVMRRIEYDGELFQDVAQKLGVTRQTFRKYLNGGQMYQLVKKKIESGLESIYGLRTGHEGIVYEDGQIANKTRRAVQQPVARPVKEAPQARAGDVYAATVQSLEALKQNVAKLHMEVARKLPSTLAATVVEQQFKPAQPTLEQHIEAVNTSIRILYDEVKYFEKAAQDERAALGKGIDLTKWKYVAAILTRIDQPDDPVHAIVKMCESTQGRTP